MLYLTSIALFDFCTDEQAGRLIKACFHYVSNGDYPERQLYPPDPCTGTTEIDPLIDGYFAILKNALDQDAKKYKEVCEKRAEAGKKGGQASTASKRRRFDE